MDDRRFISTSMPDISLAFKVSLSHAKILKWPFTFLGVTWEQPLTQP